MLCRRLLLLNCTNETILIKAITPQLGVGTSCSVGLSSCSPAPAEGPQCGDMVLEPPQGTRRDPDFASKTSVLSPGVGLALAWGQQPRHVLPILGL